MQSNTTRSPTVASHTIPPWHRVNRYYTLLQLHGTVQDFLLLSLSAVCVLRGKWREKFYYNPAVLLGPDLWLLFGELLVEKVIMWQWHKTDGKYCFDLYVYLMPQGGWMDSNLQSRWWNTSDVITPDWLAYHYHSWWKAALMGIITVPWWASVENNRPQGTEMAPMANVCWPHGMVC